MDIAYAWTCKTNEDFGPITVTSTSGKDTHQVSWGSLGPFADVQFGPHCSCKGFQFRADCKHIGVMETQRCGWNADLEPTLECAHDTDGNPVCPECSGTIISLRVAV